MTGRKPAILVVDDDVPIIVLMRSLLREFGFETATATSGSEAMAVAREQKPDLILLDKNMPGMSGDEVMHQLRQEESLRHIPVLILSGEPIDQAELSRLGANGAVMKPFDVTGLIQQIKAHLQVTSASQS